MKNSSVERRKGYHIFVHNNQVVYPVDSLKRITTVSTVTQIANLKISMVCRPEVQAEFFNPVLTPKLLLI